VKRRVDVAADADTETEQVILVHGTFASSADDCGNGWWQVGSKAYNGLKARLPANVSLAREGSIFRWSGDNTERARSKAAAQLLRFLEPLEKSGKPYHLIGHSHGGSVIWSALRIATARKKSLNQMKSWSTVGTPFLHHRSKSPWSPANLAYMIMAGALLLPTFRVFKTLFRLPYDVAMGNLDQGVILVPEAEVGFVSTTLRAPILKGLEMLGVGTTQLDNGETRLGSFDPESGETMSHFMYATSEGWLILAAIVLLGYITLLLCSFFLSTVTEGLRIGWEKRLEQRAFATYRGRWLGLWTEDDEAINGLRATLKLSVSFVGKLGVRERIFVSDLISYPWRPLYRLLAPVYNRTIRPALDSKIREIVVKTAQGNDRPAAHVVAVSPHPVLPPPASTAPPLPGQLQVAIRDRANYQANDLGPKIRELLAQPSLTAGLERFSQTLSGSELVHTSYFDHSDVLDLLALNISWSRERVRPRRSSTSAEIIAWFKDFKRLQGADVPQREFPLRIRPGKRTQFPEHDAA
jgi:hypothetical protein